MTPLQEFVSSVQERFAENRATSLTKLGVFVVVAIALSWLGSAWLRRHRARQGLARRIQSVAAAARLSVGDLDDLTRIATAGERPLIEVMTVLAAFEHATAALLANEPPHDPSTLPTIRIRPADGSRFDRVRRLRKALSFSPLPAHLWLLSTRELVVGDSVATGAVSGQVSEVNEAAFAVDWPEPAAVVVGALTNLTIDRTDDARYLARVPLLQVDALPAPSGSRAFFAHDEQPERQQDREYTRLRVKLPVTVQLTGLAETPSPSPSPPASIAGTLVDVSAGGLALDLPVSPAGTVVRGAHVRCSFTMDARGTFESLAAVVVAAGPATGQPPGVQHLRLSFIALDDTNRDRLAAAVARHQGSPSVASASAHG